MILYKFYCILLLFVELLVQTFRYYGFVPVAPGTHQLAVASDLMYLAYTVDHDGSGSD